MKHSYSRPAFLLMTVLLLAALAASCVMPVAPTPPPASATDTPPSSATAVPQPTAVTPPTGGIEEIAAFCRDYSIRGKEKQAEIPEPSASASQSGEEPAQMVVSPLEGLIYVENQVVLTGQPDQLQEISQAFDLKLRVDEKEAISLGEGRAIQLVYILDDRPVEEVTCLFNQFASAHPELDVAADPNYFFSPAGWQGGGSPWTQNGRWAHTLPGGGLGVAGDSTAFMKQWAFGDAGINLLTNGERQVREDLGKGAQIVILDTSPLPEGDFALERRMGNPTRAAGVGSPDMTITDIPVQDYDACPGLDRYSGKEIVQDISSHGLFVASLAHAVAPQSKIHLMRVLENDGCGDLMTILRGLEKTSTELSHPGASFEESLAGTVVNLSLGVHRPDNACPGNEPECTYALPESVTSLQAMVQRLNDQGAVVVAAAGNDSWDMVTPGESPRGPEIPASDPSVLSVVGSTYEQTRGCYSNQGMVAAPGGNGVNLTTTTMEAGKAISLSPGEVATCVVPGRLDASDAYWCESGNENDCVIGFAYGMDETTGKPGFQYVYWVGTSFAAPLVSGTAALMLDSGMKPADMLATLPTGVDPAGGPSDYLGSGIIDVTKLAQ